MMARGFSYWWLPPIVWALVIQVGTSAPNVPGPDVVGFDKVLHLIAYGILGVLLMRAFRYRLRWSLLRAAAYTLVIGGAYGALDEWHQSFIPGRSMEFLDATADLAGLMVAVSAVWVWDGRSRDAEQADDSEQMRRATGNPQVHEEMSRMAEALHVDESTFESEVLQAGVPALVDFWAPWCGPCLMMGPTIEKLADDYEGKAVIAKLNVDDSPDLASKYGIRSIPALLFFKDGEVADQLIGVQSEDALKAKLDALQ